MYVCVVSGSLYHLPPLSMMAPSSLSTLLDSYGYTPFSSFKIFDQIKNFTTFCPNDLFQFKQSNGFVKFEFVVTSRGL